MTSGKKNVKTYHIDSQLQSCAKLIETTVKNGVVPVATSNLKLFLNTIR